MLFQQPVAWEGRVGGHTGSSKAMPLAGHASTEARVSGMRGSKGCAPEMFRVSGHSLRGNRVGPGEVPHPLMQAVEVWNGPGGRSLHEVAGMQGGQGGGVLLGKAHAGDITAAGLVHVLQELPHPLAALA